MALFGRTVADTKDRRKRKGIRAFMVCASGKPAGQIRGWSNLFAVGMNPEADPQLRP